MSVRESSDPSVRRLIETMDFAVACGVAPEEVMRAVLDAGRRVKAGSTLARNEPKGGEKVEN